MRGERRPFAAVLITIVVAAGFAAAACGTANRSTADHSLSYSVTAHEGGVKATVADNRKGDHTTWVVFVGPIKGGHRMLLGTERGAGDDFTQSARNSRQLPSGTYGYAIYTTDAIVRGPTITKYWTPQYRIAEGKVTVP
jgi:hypothetical protein